MVMMTVYVCEIGIVQIELTLMNSHAKPTNKTMQKKTPNNVKTKYTTRVCEKLPYAKTALENTWAV